MEKQHDCERGEDVPRAGVGVVELSVRTTTLSDVEHLEGVVEVLDERVDKFPELDALSGIGDEVEGDAVRVLRHVPFIRLLTCTRK